MEKKQRYTSALKVGILTLSAIFILIFTVLWVKGRSLSAGERIDIAFNDVNGMRAGSAVQMMGLRIGQVEEITPVMQGKDSYVRLRFVVTEKGVKIPPASTISIQQSGIIGEQFLEVTPPKIEIFFGRCIKSIFHNHIFNNLLCINLLVIHSPSIISNEFSSGWNPVYTIKSVLLKVQNFISNLDFNIKSKIQPQNVINNLMNSMPDYMN